MGLCLQDGAAVHWERDLAVTLHAAAAPTIGASADSADALGRHVAATLAGAQCLGKLRSTGADSLALLVAIRSEPRDPLPPRATASGDGNLLHPMREALRAHCTVGEICNVLRAEWGTYDP